jgi:hypothetical protein
MSEQIWELALLGIGAVLLVWASARSTVIRACRAYWFIAGSILFFLVNRDITDFRLGADAGGANWDTVWAYLLFAAFILAPIIVLRMSLRDGDMKFSWTVGVFLPVVFLFLVLANFEGLEPLTWNHVTRGEVRGWISPLTVLVPLAIPVMIPCASLARKLGLTRPAALSVGVASLLVVSLAGTQLGFSEHPRNRMTHHVGDLGSWGDEDYRYFLLVNGLQLLLLAVPAGFGIAWLSAARQNVMRWKWREDETNYVCDPLVDGLEDAWQSATRSWRLLEEHEVPVRIMLMMLLGVLYAVAKAFGILSRLGLGLFSFGMGDFFIGLGLMVATRLVAGRVPFLSFLNRGFLGGSLIGALVGTVLLWIPILASCWLLAALFDTAYRWFALRTIKQDRLGRGAPW